MPEYVEHVCSICKKDLSKAIRIFGEKEIFKMHNEIHAIKDRKEKTERFNLINNKLESIREIINQDEECDDSLKILRIKAILGELL